MPLIKVVAFMKIELMDILRYLHFMQPMLPVNFLKKCWGGEEERARKKEMSEKNG